MSKDTVKVVCDTTATDENEFCAQGYTISISRNDGQALSEMEMRSTLTQTIWALEGEKSLIVLERAKT